MEDKKMWLKNKERATFIDGGYGEFLPSNGSAMGGGGDYIRPPMGAKFLKFSLIFMLAGLGALLGRTATLQIIKGANYHALAEGNRLRIRTLPAERGVILDRNGKLLVENVPTFSLFIAPGDLPKARFEREQELDYVSGIAARSGLDIDPALLDYIGTDHAYPRIER